MCSANTNVSDDLPDQQTPLQSRLYKSDRHREEFLTAYRALMATWEVEYESRFVSTDFGETYVLEVKPSAGETPNSKPLLLIPGGQGKVGMWGPAMPIPCTNRHVFSIDLIDQVGHDETPLSMLADGGIEAFAITRDILAQICDESN